MIVEADYSQYSGTEIITYLDSTEVLREQSVSSKRKRSTETPVNNHCDNRRVDNNCDNTPCHNGGTCRDSIEGFSCACERGFTGSFCEINIDDCLDNACDNNATCIDGHDKYTCVCPAGFKGDLCETHFVDGGWTDYEISGECSVTCGSGTQQMSRVCENPIPINGGKQCEGDSTKTVPCETNVVCINECGKDPTTLDNGNMNCVSENDEKRVCRPTCNDGYEFDSDLYINSSGIVCGPDTGYVWNINNEDNPESQIPSCQPKHLAPKLSVNQTGVYNTLSTETSDVENTIKSTVGDKLKTAGCVANGTCELKGVHISSSTDQSEERKRRETSFVSFTIELTCDNTIDKDNCYDLLAEIVSIFNTLVENLAFTIQYGGVDYDVGVNSTYLDGFAECETGYASVWQYCVSCGKGTYATNDYCESCPRGYYQDEEAQPSCKKCPDGWTTAGLMSRDSILCNVEKPDEDTTINWILYIIIIVVGMFFIILAVVATVYWLKKSGEEPDGDSTQCSTSSNNGNGISNDSVEMRTLNAGLSAPVETSRQPMDDYHGACNNPIYKDASANPVAYTDASGAYIILETNLDKPPLSPPPVYKKNPKNAWE
ncbi:sushi, von Willebrand factor type A, EGF and pentraxin domain-containing protein 1-like [Ruditapes philippinarum]|uniref:sushi, von Willebrand factor type A, EGF and pentraxin domain-containing protein 1-like n=1 Tax=Ruditapes philippinarum TaxID=129788 RepID=UPI00295BE402|nr:sushi, von Willebrand factor type A, EGF and pentraxin domain-containing protein 1-like [Ruditapes philippinarum]